MTTFTRIPEHIEDLLDKQDGNPSRRDFLKTSGMLVVSIGAAGLAGPLSAVAGAQVRGRIPIPTSGSSIRGSSFTKTTPRLSTSERRTAARGPAPPSAR